MALPRVIRILFALGGAAILYVSPAHSQPPTATRAAQPPRPPPQQHPPLPPPLPPPPPRHLLGSQPTAAQARDAPGARSLPPRPESMPRPTPPVSGCGLAKRPTSELVAPTPSNLCRRFFNNHTKHRHVRMLRTFAPPHSPAASQPVASASCPNCPAIPERCNHAAWEGVSPKGDVLARKSKRIV